MSANPKRRADGRMRSTIVFNNKRYYIYGFTVTELRKKEREKLKMLKNEQLNHENPTLND